MCFRDWSLVTAMEGGLQNRMGGCEVLPLRTGGRAVNVLAILKAGGGAQQVLG